MGYKHSRREVGKIRYLKKSQEIIYKTITHAIPCIIICMDFLVVLFLFDWLVLVF